MELIFCTKQDRNRISAIQKIACQIDFKVFLSTQCLTLDNLALAVSFNSKIINLLIPILMPRYFTEFVVYNLLPFNFSFKVVSVCFLIDLKKPFNSTQSFNWCVFVYKLSEIEDLLRGLPPQHKRNLSMKLTRMLISLTQQETC